MKLLKIYNRDKTPIKNIVEFNYTSLSDNKVNEVKIYENPKIYENKIVEVWDFNKPIISGIIKKYSWSKEKNEGSIFIYPLIIDLQDDFIEDGVGNKIYYISDSIEGVLEEILDQYLTSSKIPIKILSKGSFATTGRNVQFTFNYASLYDAMRFLQTKMLLKGFYIKIDVTGKVDLLNLTNSVDLKNFTDIETIDFVERIDENIKTIIFDNKSSDNHILKEYTNPDPSVTTGKVKYLPEARFKDETSVDNYVQAYFEEKGSPKVEVKQIITDVDVPLYSKVNIYNWEKNFGEIYVVGKSYLPSTKEGNKQKYNLKLGTDDSFKAEGSDERASLSEEIDVAVQEVPTVPDYIKETYIDSVEVRSPTISGNTGLFSEIFKVGVDGIVINGTEKTIKSSNFVTGSDGWKIFNDGSAEFNNIVIRSDIKSSNYNLANKVGWGILENGEFLFGRDANNYFQFDGLNFILSGKLIAKAGSSIEWDYVENAPINEWANPEYIKSTYIDETSIKSPTIYGNDGYFSGIFKVGSAGIVIDGIGKTIKSDNYNPGTDGWIIKNNGDVEFQDGIFRGVINATSGTFSGNITSSATITGGTFSGGIYEATSGSDKIKLFNYGGLPTIQFIDGGRIGANINLKEDLLISEFKILKKVSSFIDKVFIGIKNETYIEIRYSGLGDEEFKFIGGDINMDGNHIQNVNNLYCDDLYASRIRANYMNVYGDNFQFNYCPMAIPSSTGSGANSMPSVDVAKGQMHLEGTSGYVAKLWVYDGENWGYVSLTY